ncbi:MAG: hypothetical protein ACUVRC_04210 [Desulfotomaculales bacterium]
MAARWWQRVKGVLRPPRRPPPELAGLERRVQELQEVVNRMAAELAAVLKDPAAQSFDVRIDRVAVERVHLDKLIFNIDGIGVKDLSGSLSIGVNYGGKVMRLVSLPPGKSEEKSMPVRNLGARAAAAPDEDGFSYRTYRPEGEKDERKT